MFQLGCWTPAQGWLFFLALGRGRVGGVLDPHAGGGFSFSPRLVEASLSPPCAERCGRGDGARKLAQHSEGECWCGIFFALLALLLAQA